MRKILITGANGFVGSHLTDFCIAKGYDVYALDMPDINLRHLTHYTNGKQNFSHVEKLEFFEEFVRIPSNNEKLTILECNLKNSNLLEKIIKEIAPDLIFHLGAQPYIIPSWEDPVNTIETNVIGTINIFEPIKKYKLRTKVILACTSTEFGTTATTVNRPLKEEDPLMAIHPYGISKIAAELLARQYYINFGIEIINLRFFNLTGVRRTNDACSDFIRKIAQIELEQTEPVLQVGNLNPYRDIMGIKDALRAIWLAATKGTLGETYHICSSKKIQIREILNIAISFSTKKIKVIENEPTKLRATDEDIIIGDNSKIKKQLGFELNQSIKEILKEMFNYWIEYYKTNKN